MWWRRRFSTEAGSNRLHNAIERLNSGLIYADSTTYGLLLRECCNGKALDHGKLIHAHMRKNGYVQDTFLGNLLVKMYSNCACIDEAQEVFFKIRHKNVFSWNIMVAAYAQNGDLHHARKLFNEMPRKDAVSWTTMITAYAHEGHHREAIKLFKLMDLNGSQPDRVAFISVLNACGSTVALQELDSILELALNEVSIDVVLGTSIVSMYGKCGRVQESRIVFDNMSERNVVTWTVMVEVHAENGHLQEGMRLFEMMAGWSTASWVVVINAHASSGEIKEAECLLERMSYRNVAAWTIVISTNAHSGDLQKAVKLFQLMDQEGILPDRVTLVSVLDACVKFEALSEGKLVERGIYGTEFMDDEIVITNLINLHGKCGSLIHASSLFFSECFLQDSVILWTSMMSVYAQNGHRDEAIELFHCVHLYGMEPTRITFTIMLFVCSHRGSLHQGWQYFTAMQLDHGIHPDIDHYVSMIDLLGRCGDTLKAFELIRTMPFVPDDVAWTTLLSACKVYGESNRGALAAEELMDLGFEDSAPYVLLASACRTNYAPCYSELTTNIYSG